jgi:hypothetical protein
MLGQPFSLANLRETADALYGKSRWQGLLARDLNIPERIIQSWFAGKPMPDLRKVLADLCRRHDPKHPTMERMARKLEKLGPPE